MSLLQYVKNTIYQASGEEIKTPDAYERFGILIPESASTAQGVRPFPLPDDEHLFALFWNIHDGHKLSVNIAKKDGTRSISDRRKLEQFPSFSIYM